MITSTSNPRIKNLLKLMQKPKERREQKVFVSEGEKMFQEVPREWLREIYVSESYYNRKKEDLLQEPISCEIVSDGAFKMLSDTVTPQGVLCVAAQPEYSLEKLWEKKQACFLMLEDLQDPGNLGTILRSAEAAGAAGVLLSRGCVDIFNPKTVRATMGSIYRVPFLYVEDLAQTAEMLKRQGVPVYAAHLKDSTDYEKADYTKGCAFLIGNEGAGLSEELCRHASGYIKIPMQGQVESLNAAVAASLLMYEAARQRRSINLSKNHHGYETDSRRVQV